MQEQRNALMRLAEQKRPSSADAAFTSALLKASLDVRVTFGNGCVLSATEDPESAIGVRMVGSSV